MQTTKILKFLVFGTLAGCAAHDGDVLDDASGSAPEFDASTSAEIRRGFFATPYGPLELPYRIVDGLKIMGGDIVLGEELSSVRDRAAVLNLSSAKWPQNVIFYSVDPKLEPDVNRPTADPEFGEGDRVINAIRDWEAVAPIRFVRNAAAPVRIHFQRSASACRSAVGHQNAVQIIEIDDPCYQSGVRHEIGHALGLFHEHQRHDRLTAINMHACTSGFRAADWAEIGPSGADVGPFDFNSIMLYDGCVPCSSTNPAPRMTRKSNSTCFGASSTISAGDVSGVQWLHGLWRGTKIGAPGRDFAISNAGTLYGVQPDGGGVWRYSGSGESWTNVGGAGTQRILAGGTKLYRVATDGNVFVYAGGTTWTQIGSPGRDFAVDSTGMLYAVQSDGLGIWRYNGSWANIGPGGTRLYAGGSRVFKTVTNGDIHRYDGGTTWTKVGAPGRGFAVDRLGRLYGIQSDGQAVWMYSGSGESWSRIGGPAASIYPADDTIFAVSPANGEVWRYQGTPQWAHINGPATKVYAAGSRVAAVTNAGDVYAYAP